MCLDVTHTLMLFSVSQSFPLVLALALFHQKISRSPSTHKMAPWVRTLFIHMMPRLLLMKRPSFNDLEEELASKYSIRSKGRAKANERVRAKLQLMS